MNTLHWAFNSITTTCLELCSGRSYSSFSIKGRVSPFPKSDSADNSPLRKSFLLGPLPQQKLKTQNLSSKISVAGSPVTDPKVHVGIGDTLSAQTINYISTWTLRVQTSNLLIWGPGQSGSIGPTPPEGQTLKLEDQLHDLKAYMSQDA